MTSNTDAYFIAIAAHFAFGLHFVIFFQRALKLLAECLPHLIVEISTLEVDHLICCTLTLMITPFAREDNEDYRLIPVNVCIFLGGGLNI